MPREAFIEKAKSYLLKGSSRKRSGSSSESLSSQATSDTTFDLRIAMQAQGHSDLHPAAFGVLLVASLDVLLIVAAAVVLLPQNLDWLFSNTDAELYYALDRVGREFGSWSLFSNFNPVAVLGTLMSQLNPFLHPIHYLWYSTNNLVVPYVLLAALLYLATFSLGQALQYPVFPSRLAGYAMSVFWVPFYGPFSVDIMARLCPWATYIVCVQLFAWSLFVVVGSRGRIPRDLASCGLFCVVFTYAFLVEFSYAALSAPFSVVFFLAILASSASKRELAIKSFALVACLLCLIAIDLRQIASTATQLSTRMADYTGHSIPVASRSYLASLLRNDYYQLTKDTLQAVPYLKALALVGIAFGVCAFPFLPQLVSRRIFCVTVAGALCFLGLYLMSKEYMVSNVIWPWPAPAYFEWIGHPIYALSGFAALYFLAYGAFRGLVDLTRRVKRGPYQSQSVREIAAAINGESAHRVTTRFIWFQITLLALPITVTIVANKNLPFDHKNATITDVSGVLPPAWTSKDEVTDAIAGRIALRRGEEYRGSFLSTLPDAVAKRSYQMRNLVPTMMEYRYQRGDTLQSQAIRNLILHSPFERHVELLRLFGVSYVQYPRPAMSPHLQPAPKTEFGTGTNFLYQVADPNLAGYTPTTIRHVHHWSQFVDAVSGQEIDWRNTAFLEAHQGVDTGVELVVPSKLGKLIVTADGLEFESTSHGASLVVLPRSFSNCYRWRPALANTASVKLVRVNFVQLGVFFRGDVRGTIVVDMDWGGGAECLEKDIRDLYSLGVRRVQTPESLHPQGYLGFFGRAISRRQQSELRSMLEEQ